MGFSGLSGSDEIYGKAPDSMTSLVNLKSEEGSSGEGSSEEGSSGEGSSEEEEGGGGRSSEEEEEGRTMS